MNRNFIVCLLAVFGTGCIALGAPESDPAPRPPFVNMAPAGSRWTVSMEGKSHKQPTPVQLEMLTGRNQIQQVTVSYAGGKRDVFYYFKDAIFQKASNTDKVLQIHMDEIEKEDEDTLLTGSFPGIGWISKQNYVGIATSGSARCFHYRGSGRHEAWINIENGYPVRVQTEDCTYAFSPVTEYPQDVQLSGKFLAALQKAQREINALDALSRANKAQH